ncbi:16S rRNA (cytidine(1402)-2'-O)-methyltransferase [Selenomonas sp. oral taxon 138]|uniref:16S rRNA (cytidine(1402)-2'-O)-methyltransferase n=1 Tax=Selenomonas sp. oral taxon 138 TaxID=712532 RepID=UPI0002A45E3E|nr:16S rRNA (cytidine(1402)-2'-O)-methyltransferase [Selenomonas sp. oral taxon 138]EKX97151.1 S-adenosylmethionine-dependent methyltransferase, YraL family [Selenomonas sp. oral taxon 138 str. F0429]
MTVTGKLYLCATPIGNLGDITYRAVETLRAADLIAAEDTRHTRGLLAHYDIHTPMTSYHEHNKEEKGAELIARMQAGENIVCVSDAGLPGIADPGSDLARRAIAEGIPVTPLPGANAALSALICAGLPLEGFTFVGFLPRKEKKRREVLARVAAYPETLIFYEAPHRLKETLAALAAALGAQRHACAARELTKKFEEFRRTTLGDLLAHYREHESRGEFVLIVAGADDNAASTADAAEEMSLTERYAAHIAKGLDKKEAMRRTAQELGISRRDVYQAVLAGGD